MTLHIKSSSQWPVEDLRTLIQYAGQEIDTKDVCVKVKNTYRTNGWSGWAYNGVPNAHTVPLNTRYLVTMLLAPPGRMELPQVSKYRKRAPEIAVYTWQEAVIHIAAHELAHVHYYKHGNPTGESDEVACEFHALSMVERFRSEYESLSLTSDPIDGKLSPTTEGVPHMTKVLKKKVGRPSHTPAYVATVRATPKGESVQVGMPLTNEPFASFQAAAYHRDLIRKAFGASGKSVAEVTPRIKDAIEETEYSEERGRYVTVLSDGWFLILHGRGAQVEVAA